MNHNQYFGWKREDWSSCRSQYVTENPSAYIHLYGKLEAKHNRKMGHVTLFSDVPDSVEEFGKGIDF